MESVTGPQAVYMHVNKYVHPCECIPSSIKKEDMDLLTADYDKKEYEKIQQYLTAFDDLVIQMCGSTDGSVSRMKRYKQHYLPDEGCDKETEKNLSYVMFVDDIKDIRKLLIRSLEETLNIQTNLEKKFAKERDFFSE